jgi:hypothetical protein
VTEAEAEWNASINVSQMLCFLHQERRASARKLRLFACACVRRVLDLADHPSSRRAIKVAEAFADGLQSSKELREAYSALQSQSQATDQGQVILAVSWAANPYAISEYLAIQAAAYAVSARKYDGIEFAEQGCHAAILRDVFGHALQALVPRSSNYGGTPTRIARFIYDRRSFEDLPILADALEEAGCDNADILNHCRQPGEHVRGCWALDAVLGKE